MLYFMFATAMMTAKIKGIMFEYGYKKAANTYPYISKFDYCIQSENGYKLNTSILYNTDNFLRNYIIDEFKKALGQS